MSIEDTRSTGGLRERRIRSYLSVSQESGSVTKTNSRKISGEKLCNGTHRSLDSCTSDVCKGCGRENVNRLIGWNLRRVSGVMRSFVATVADADSRTGL